MDQVLFPNADRTPAADLAAEAEDRSGEGEGLTGPRQFPAVSPDAIRAAFESGKYPYARLMGRAPYEVEKAKLQAELLDLELAGQVERLPGGLFQRLVKA